MTIPSGGWDPTNPAGTRKINLGDDDIRQLKAQVQEVIAIDHKFETGTDADNGKHTKISLLETDNIGTGAEGKPILGAQTISDKAELVFTDEDDNDIQITTGGVLKPSTDTTLANWSAIMNLVYPVGSIYANYDVATNPGTLLGVGTWVAIEEEVIAGYKAGGTFGTIGSLAAGTETVTLTVDQIPAHTHNTGPIKNAQNYLGGSAGCQWRIDSTAETQASSSTGGGESHNNIQPTYVAYLWRRTE